LLNVVLDDTLLCEQNQTVHLEVTFYLFEEIVHVTGVFSHVLSVHDGEKFFLVATNLSKKETSILIMLVHQETTFVSFFFGRILRFLSLDLLFLEIFIVFQGCTIVISFLHHGSCFLFVESSQSFHPIFLLYFVI
jgi:hypothetical protein